LSIAAGSTRSAGIAVALDSDEESQILNWARLTAPGAQAMKIGLQAYLSFGRQIVEKVREAAPKAEMFLDLKLHDIPNTVWGAANSLQDLHVDYLTVHASGGAKMIESAARALPETRIAAVTVLTSLSPDDLLAMGVSASAEGLVVRWAQLAESAGARAIVCSPEEVATVRSVVSEATLLITPGVRPAGVQLVAGTTSHSSDSDAHIDDQQRTSTPQVAQDSGADLLVIGRPITSASDPAQAISAIRRSLHPR
jgi:orotidine-5'-phosphate decarboxylase